MMTKTQNNNEGMTSPAAGEVAELVAAVHAAYSSYGWVEEKQFIRLFDEVSRLASIIEEGCDCSVYGPMNWQVEIERLRQHSQPHSLPVEAIEDEDLWHFFCLFCREDFGNKFMTYDQFSKGARAAIALDRSRQQPQPVPMSERPWEREGWCDEKGQCWWFNPGEPAMANPHIATSSWRLCHMLNGKPMGTHSLPHDAFPHP